jgi:hypothetical protein
MDEAGDCPAYSGSGVLPLLINTANTEWYGYYDGRPRLTDMCSEFRLHAVR